MRADARSQSAYGDNGTSTCVHVHRVFYAETRGETYARELCVSAWSPLRDSIGQPHYSRAMESAKFYLHRDTISRDGRARKFRDGIIGRSAGSKVKFYTVCIYGLRVPSVLPRSRGERNVYARRVAPVKSKISCITRKRIASEP